MRGFWRRRSAATLGVLVAVAIAVVVAAVLRAGGDDAGAPAVLPTSPATSSAPSTVPPSGSPTSPSTVPPPSLAAALAAAVEATGRFDGWTEARVALGARCLRVVVADEEGERHQGLRGVDDPAPYDGMLFLFSDDVDAPFTMSGVPVDLDIGWYDVGGAPVDRARMVACPDGDDATCPLYRASSRFRLALETPAGASGAGALGGCTA